MKKFVLMVAMVVSCVCMAQNSHAQTGRDGNTDIDMLSMKNFYAIDIVESGHVLKVMPEDEYLAVRKKN